MSRSSTCAWVTSRNRPSISSRRSRPAPRPRSTRLAKPSRPTAAVPVAWPMARRSNSSACLPCSGYWLTPTLTATTCAWPATLKLCCNDVASFEATRIPSVGTSIQASSTAKASSPIEATTSLARRPARKRTATLRRNTLAASMPSAASVVDRPSMRSTSNAIGAGSRSRSASRWVMCSNNCAWLGRPVARSVAWALRAARSRRLRSTLKRSTRAIVSPSAASGGSTSCTPRRINLPY